MAQKAGYNAIKKFSDQFIYTSEGSLSLHMENDPDAGGSLPISGDAAKILAERITAENQLLYDTVGFECINQIPLTLDYLKSINTSGTWSGNAYTRRDVVFTVTTDENGSVTEIDMNGTANGGVSAFYLFNNLTVSEDSILNGLTSGSNTTYYIETYDGTNYIMLYDGEKDIPAKTYNYSSIGVRKDQAVNHVKVYPMLRKAIYTDATFVPYHPSVDECKTDNTVIAPVEDGSTASQAYGIGQHFIKDGAFCTAISTIASGATLTLNTNYKNDEQLAKSLYEIAPLVQREYSNLSDIRLGSMGVANFSASISPTGSLLTLPFICFGTPTIRTIIVYRSGDHKIYINKYESSAWQGWYGVELTAV